ncbi:urease subunit beta, partial [Amycolatopsis mediterranei]|uniref:urease subunit beta n=1 Tax=Amycolatopsis mediterranei TaxID=33910 RepID=UPI00332AAFE3
MRPGEIIPGDEPVELNPGRARVRLLVRNLGDRPVQVGRYEKNTTQHNTPKKQSLFSSSV